jgi:hypothetical protein
MHRNLRVKGGTFGLSILEEGVSSALAPAGLEIGTEGRGTGECVASDQRATSRSLKLPLTFIPTHLWLPDIRKWLSGYCLKTPLHPHFPN